MIREEKQCDKYIGNEKKTCIAYYNEYVAQEKMSKAREQLNKKKQEVKAKQKKVRKLKNSQTK
jgi:hypothetical protein